MDDPTLPAAPQPYANVPPQPWYGPPQPGYGAAQPGYAPAPPDSRGSSHLWVIILSIVGGLILLAGTFMTGAAVGFWVGAHHGARMSISVPGWGPHEGPLPCENGSGNGNGNGNSNGNGNGNGNTGNKDSRGWTCDSTQP